MSGRISGMRLEWAETNFFNAQCEVTKFYNADTIVNPLNIRPFLGVKKWLFYMISDIRKQRKCTHTAMLYAIFRATVNRQLKDKDTELNFCKFAKKLN